MRQKTFGKWLAAAGILIVMTIWMVLPALAAPTVNSIRITFKDKYEDPGVIEEPEISCSSYGIEITSVEWNKDVEKWNPGMKVTATLILSSSGREFSSSYGSKSCQISGATLSKAVKVDDDLKVTVTYYPVVWLESPDEAGWSASNHMKAVWKKVDYATGYQIRLYRDDYYLRTIDATGTSKDLSEYMGREGNYYYEIRAVGGDDILAALAVLRIVRCLSHRADLVIVVSLSSHILGEVLAGSRCIDGPEIIVIPV